MKTQIVTFLNALFATIFNLVSNPQRARLLLTVAVIALILAVLFVSGSVTLADHMGGG